MEFLDKEGIYGAHGGSGLSALGGSIRLGELLPGGSMRHALKLNFAAQLNYYRNPCFRWPSQGCDDYSNDPVNGYGGKVPGFVPGALLAIPASVDINSLGLVTAPAKSIAWTLQNYGGYVTDDTFNYDIFTLCAELGPHGSVRDEFLKTYGYPVNSVTGDWVNDLSKIHVALSVVDNWDFNTWLRVRTSAGAEGSGGGKPRQPWAESIPSTTKSSSAGITRYQIFSDALRNGWNLHSDGQTYITTEAIFSGNSSQKLVTTAPWQNYNLYINSGTIPLNGYHYIHFAMKSGNAQQVCVEVMAYEGDWSNSLPKAGLFQHGPVNNQYWSVFNIPLTTVSSTSAISRILISECQGTFGHTFYIDEVELVSDAYDTTLKPLLTSSLASSYAVEIK